MTEDNQTQNASQFSEAFPSSHNTSEALRVPPTTTFNPYIKAHPSQRSQQDQSSILST